MSVTGRDNKHRVSLNATGPAKRLRCARRGSTLVEFAIVAPLIFLFFFASIEFGRVLMVIQAIESAAREGCREAVGYDVSLADVQDVVTSRLSTFGIGSHTVTVDPNPPTDACQWDPITVRIQVSYDQVSWLPVPDILQGITLTGSSTLPQESDPCED